MKNTKIMNFETKRNLFVLVIKSDVSQLGVDYYTNTRSNCSSENGKKKKILVNRFNHNFKQKIDHSS